MKYKWEMAACVGRRSILTFSPASRDDDDLAPSPVPYLQGQLLHKL